jgi:hypothetical protein
MSGLRSRRKGARIELDITHRLQAAGFAAEKISRMYQPGHDVNWSLLGVDRRVEVKCRGNGFGRLYTWLTGADLLVACADRCEPLAVLPLELLIEIATAAERNRQ